MATYNTIADGLRLSGSTGCTNDIVNSWLKGLSLTGTTPDMLFTYLRSTGLTGSLSDMLSTYVFGQINFIELEAAASASYTLGSPPEFAGDFKISFDVVGSDLTSDQAIIDSSVFAGSTAGEILLFIDNPNGLDLLISRGSGGAFDRIVFGGQAEILNGDFNKAVLQRVSGVITAKLNGTQLGGSLNNTSTIRFSEGFIGGGDGRFFNGILSNLSLENTTTPANSLAFTLGELTANYELPINNVFGSELVTNGDFATNVDDWSGEGAATLTWDAGTAKVIGAGASGLSQQFATVAGEAYEVFFTVVESIVSTRVRISDGAGLTGDIVDGAVTVGAYTSSVTFVALSATSTIYLRANSTGTVRWDNASIKQVTNALTYNNIATTQDVRDTYTLSNDGTQWVGALQTIDIAAQA